MKKIYILLALILFFSDCTYAETLDSSLFSPAGIINRQNKEQLKDLKTEEKLIETTIDKKPAIKEDTEEFQDENYTYNPSFPISEIIFVGNTKISDKKLKKLSKKYINTTVKLSDIQNLVKTITEKYHEKGYISSYAYLPEQEIDSGVLTINIHEGLTGDCNVYGNRWERDWYFENVFKSNKLEKGKVFNVKHLQGALKDLDEEDYITPITTIEKDKNGNTVVELKVQDRLPLNVNLIWDDYGRDMTGRQRFTPLLGINNLTGFGDKIYGGAVISSRSIGSLAGYNAPISKFGTRLAFDYSYSRVNLGGIYKQYQINGTSTDYSLRIIQPIVNDATKEISSSVGINFVNSSSKSDFYQTSLSDYGLRVLRANIDGIFDDSYGRTIADIGFNYGIDGLGAHCESGSPYKKNFFKVTAAVTRVQRVRKESLAIFRLNGQYSPDKLFATEQMYLGGVYSIRGYQPSEILGDYGIAGSLEFRVPVPFLKEVLPEKYKDLSRKIQLAAFYDFGYVKDNGNLYGYPKNFLHSIGFGANLNITDTINVQLGVGFPLGNKPYNEGSGRYYFSVSSDLDKLLLKPKTRL